MSTVTTLTNSSVQLTLTCISGQDAGWYSGTTLYYVSYKLTSASSWVNTTSQSCGSPITISGLSSVSSYQFAAYAWNDFGFGPLTASASYETATTYGPPETPLRPTLTQNNDKTVTISWARPSPLNDDPAIGVKYLIELKTSIGGWTTPTPIAADSTINSTLTSLTKIVNMTDLKA